MLFLYLVQTPAPVYNIKVTSYNYSALVTWRIPTPKDSSYITKIIIYLNGAEYQNISRGTQIDIKGLKLYTEYTVGIVTEDGSSQRSNKVSKHFGETNEAGKYKRNATEFASVFQCLNFVCKQCSYPAQ